MEAPQVKFLVVTHQHHLLPFAWRLHKEGADVTTVVFADRYERAWDGLIPKALTSRTKLEKEAKRIPRDGDLPEGSPWGPLVEQARAGELHVLTDSRRAMELFAGCPNLFGIHEDKDAPRVPTMLALDAWFDGESFSLPHWVVQDWGAWQGGMGPAVLAGGTLVWQGPGFVGPLGLLDTAKDLLKTASFKGMVSMGVAYDTVAGQWQPQALRVGWPFLHTHLLFSELPSLTLLFAGSPDTLGLEKRFVTALVVSQPPWPHLGNLTPARVPLEGLSSEDRGSLFFHDVLKDGEGLSTAGLDGLVAVARGAGNSPEAARLGALGVASRVVLPERQFRPDIGGQVGAALVGLEGMGLY